MEWQELIGDDIPYHLRINAPPLATCIRCGRETHNADDVDVIDTMIQPSGLPCGGMFISDAPHDSIIWPKEINYKPEDY